jgi:dolichol-phosphate mannosyltransferase
MGSIEEAQLKEIRSQFPADWEVPDFRIDFWDGKTKDYCVIIPVINEGERIRQFAKRLKENNIDSIVDIIIVDGGSTDGSLERNHLRLMSIQGLIVKVGPGKLSAQLRVAYSFAVTLGYIGVVTIDGNNKDDPASIPSFVRALKDGYDFVQASRYLRGGVSVNTPIARDLAIRLLHAPALSLSSGFRWTDTTQGFRGYSRNLLVSRRLQIFREIFAGYELLAYLSSAAPRHGFQCVELPTKREYPLGSTPTKISSFRGNLQVFKVLVKSCLGMYEPSSVNRSD